jgi:hypothetical protein
MRENAGEGTSGFDETCSAFRLPKAEWSQQVRSPADEGIGQLGPQQDAFIAVSASAVRQLKPRGNTSASATNAKNTFTATNLSLGDILRKFAVWAD